jgi:hypothetical protein
MDDETKIWLGELGLIVAMAVTAAGARQVMAAELDRLFPADPQTGSSGSFVADLVRSKLSEHSEAMAAIEAARRRRLS